MYREVLESCRVFASYKPDQQVKLIKMLLLSKPHPIIFMALVALIVVSSDVSKRLKQ